MITRMQSRERQQRQTERDHMVDQQIAARGIDDERVLAAMRAVPREAFLPPAMQEFAYADTPLPIAAGQTISQPYIVARMTTTLGLGGGERVLEVGTGSGYAAAVLGEIAGEVHTIERQAELARGAEAALDRLGYEHVHVHIGDGTRGLAARAPFDAIVVTAGGPVIPETLARQLAVGGRLVIPVAVGEEHQALVQVRRLADNDWEERRLEAVRFVPLIGAEGWLDGEAREVSPAINQRRERTDDPPQAPAPRRRESDHIAAAAEPFEDLASADLASLLDRIGGARVVCIGEESHGTEEFYRLRARLTRELVTRRGFTVVAIEGDWPDASRIDQYVCDRYTPPATWTAFSRFPTWMWRNEAVRDFVDWLHEHNATLDSRSQRVRFHGLDLYSMYTSIDEVLGHLDATDPAAARVARERYGCLTPYQRDPIAYARAAADRRFHDCQQETVAVLQELGERRLRDLADSEDEGLFDAIQNARLVANAEEYYRRLYEGHVVSWNLRDLHMFQTLQVLMQHYGPTTKVVIWAHNSHLGDARATDMARRGEHNLGQLCRETLGPEAYLIGFGTHTGTVAAADEWGGSMRVKEVRPSLAGSIERLCHDTGIGNFLLPCRHARDPELTATLEQERLERAIGVIYRPDTERQSHYFQARLAQQFDEYIWFDETEAVRPLRTAELTGTPDTYPFGV